MVGFSSMKFQSFTGVTGRVGLAVMLSMGATDMKSRFIEAFVWQVDIIFPGDFLKGFNLDKSILGTNDINGSSRPCGGVVLDDVCTLVGVVSFMSYVLEELTGV